MPVKTLYASVVFISSLPSSLVIFFPEEYARAKFLFSCFFSVWFTAA